MPIRSLCNVLSPVSVSAESPGGFCVRPARLCPQPHGNGPHSGRVEADCRGHEGKEWRTDSGGAGKHRVSLQTNSTLIEVFCNPNHCLCCSNANLTVCLCVSLPRSPSRGGTCLCSLIQPIRALRQAVWIKTPGLSATSSQRASSSSWPSPSPRTLASTVSRAATHGQLEREGEEGRIHKLSTDQDFFSPRLLFFFGYSHALAPLVVTCAPEGSSRGLPTEFRCDAISSATQFVLRNHFEPLLLLPYTCRTIHLFEFVFLNRSLSAQHCCMLLWRVLPTSYPASTVSKQR